MLGPLAHARRGGLDPGQATFVRKTHQPRYPFDTVFGSPREVAEPGMRAHDHQHVRKALDENAEIGLRSILPLVLQPASVDAADIDAVETAGDRVEASGVDDDIERVLSVACLDAVGRDAPDRRLVDIDQFNIGLVVDLVVAGFERHAASAEAVVLRDQLLGYSRILDALPDLARDKIREQPVGLAVDQDVAEIALPNAKPRLGIELFPEGLAFLRCYLVSAAQVGG